MTAQTEVTDIERAACQILADGMPENPTLRAWVAQVIGDPAFQDYLDMEADSLRTLLSKGTYVSDAPWMPGIAPPLVRSLDRAAYLLAGDVVSHRRHGRASGDQTIELWGVGGPAAVVTTSLAAAVAEYVKRVRDAYATEIPYED